MNCCIKESFIKINFMRIVCWNLKNIPYFKVYWFTHMPSYTEMYSLFNLYSEYIMRNAGLDEDQSGIKIAGRNISKLRYADDMTLMAKSEVELKSLLMKVKEESEKAGLNFNIQKTKAMASGPIASWQINWGKRG